MTLSSTPPATALRRQYSVGHGGFHATIVNPGLGQGQALTYVYDVGAQPSVAVLEMAIDAFVSDLVGLGVGIIDYIFLSHIDTDHLNRLEYLLARLARPPVSSTGVSNRILVGELVIPWLSPVEKLLARHRCRETKLVLGMTSADGDDDAYLKALGVEKVVRIGAPTTSSRQTHRSGESLVKNHSSGWHLIPLCLERDEDIITNFLEYLSRGTRGEVEIGGSKYDPSNTSHHSDILREFRTHMRRAMIKAARKSGLRAPAQIANWSSLALLSGSTQALHPCDLGDVNQDIEAACTHFWLHTGDLPLKSTTGFLKTFKSAVTPTAKLCVLVSPHHGSEHSHDPAIYDHVKKGTVLINTGLYNSGAMAKGVNPSDAILSARGVGATHIELRNPVE